MSLFPQFLIILFCLAGSAFFSGMETGVISIHRLRLHHLVRERIRGAMIIQKFIEQPDHLLGTTLVGTNLCTVIATVTAVSIATRLIGAWGTLVSDVVMTLVLLIACEYLPKAWFQSRPAARVVPFAQPLHLAGYIFYPVSRVITIMANAFIPASFKQGHENESIITRDDLHYLTRECEQTGALSPDERRMIHGVFELTRKTCDEIMVPFEKMVLVSSDTKREDLLNLARSKGFTRLPVYHEEVNRVAGIVHALDVALDESPDPAKTARDYMRPPQFVPADTPTDALLPRMRLSRQPMALVTDEQSRVIGLVTIEDVLEEIVGEL